MRSLLLNSVYLYINIFDNSAKTNFRCTMFIWIPLFMNILLKFESTISFVSSLQICVVNIISLFSPYANIEGYAYKY